MTTFGDYGNLKNLRDLGDLEVSTRQPQNTFRHTSDRPRGKRLCCGLKFLQTVTLYPALSVAKLVLRTAKLLTWVPAKYLCYTVAGFRTEAPQYLEREYLKTVKVVRDLLFLPSVAKRAFQDITAPRETDFDTPMRKETSEYLKVGIHQPTQEYSSHLHGLGKFEVIEPQGIGAVPATNDPHLKAVMASHIFKPGILGINFGTPNVATFITEPGEKEGSVEITKVDAKSMRREAMKFHPTGGKLQDGVFLVPTNLPDEALTRFKMAALHLEGSKDITCVNTNCRVLEAAGFSIEGVKMDEIVFPNTLIEHLLFRHVFYTDLGGKKHRVHFDIINTTGRPLQKFFEDVDTAVVGSRLRHRRRHNDTPEQQKARGAAAKALIAEEAGRLANQPEASGDFERTRRPVTISVPSLFGQLMTRLWAQHTMYELDLSDKWTQIHSAFQQLTTCTNEELTLKPFAKRKFSAVNWIKKNVLFSGLSVRFLRRHMIGRADIIDMHSQDIFNHLKSTKGARLNYVIFDGKMVVARVEANQKGNKVQRASDWALSKHALLSGRKDVLCSGEMWYDEAAQKFYMNDDSGTYTPNLPRVQLAAELANAIFESDRLGVQFEGVSAHTAEANK